MAEKLDLVVLTARLKGIRAVVITAVVALETQRADRDDDIALALLRGAADPLADEIERLESLSEEGAAP
jgi:hypothetical protein